MSLFNQNNRAGFIAAVDATTSEAQFAGLWGEMNATTIQGVVASATVDAGHTDYTTTLRAGMVLSYDYTTFKLGAHNATVGNPAVGVLAHPVEMLVAGVATDRDITYLTSGQVRVASLYTAVSPYTLTYQAAMELRNQGFKFDDYRYNFTGGAPIASVNAGADPGGTALALRHGYLHRCSSGAAMDFTLPNPAASNVGLSIFAVEAAPSTVVTVKTVAGSAGFITNAAASADTYALAGLMQFRVVYTGATLGYRWMVVSA